MQLLNQIVVLSQGKAVPGIPPMCVLFILDARRRQPGVCGRTERHLDPVAECWLQGNAGEEEQEAVGEGESYQLEMMRCMREVNADNNTVGWCVRGWRLGGGGGVGGFLAASARNAGACASGGAARGATDFGSTLCCIPHLHLPPLAANLLLVFPARYVQVPVHHQRVVPGGGDH